MIPYPEDYERVGWQGNLNIIIGEITEDVGIEYASYEAN